MKLLDAIKCCIKHEVTVNASTLIPSTVWLPEDIFKEIFEDYKTELLGPALDHEYYKLTAELDGAVYATIIRKGQVKVIEAV